MHSVACRKSVLTTADEPWINLRVITFEIRFFFVNEFYYVVIKKQGVKSKIFRKGCVSGQNFYRGIKI